MFLHHWKGLEHKTTFYSLFFWPPNLKWQANCISYSHFPNLIDKAESNTEDARGISVIVTAPLHEQVPAW